MARWDGRGRRRENQDTSGRRAVQVRPGQLDLLQLAEHLTLEVADGNSVGCKRTRSQSGTRLNSHHEDFWEVPK